MDAAATENQAAPNDVAEIGLGSEGSGLSYGPLDHPRHSPVASCQLCCPPLMAPRTMTDQVGVGCPPSVAPRPELLRAGLQIAPSTQPPRFYV
jgi:hypothetical protein